MIKDMEQGIESRIRVTVKDTRSKFQDFSLKTFLSRYFDRLTGEARPGWVCGWSQASPCQELDWQGVRSFQPSEIYCDRSFLGKTTISAAESFVFRRNFFAYLITSSFTWSHQRSSVDSNGLLGITGTSFISRQCEQQFHHQTQNEVLSNAKLPEEDAFEL